MKLLFLHPLTIVLYLMTIAAAVNHLIFIGAYIVDVGIFFWGAGVYSLAGYIGLDNLKRKAKT